MIILKVTKNQGLTLSSEDTFLEKIPGGIKFPPYLSLDRFRIKLPQRLDLTSSDKHVILQILSTYYTWKNIRK